jgi:membrane protein
MLSWLGHHFLNGFSDYHFLIADSFNLFFSTLIIAILFAAVYKYLPDAEIHWRDVRVGAGVTAVLFTIGKILIAMYIGKSDLASVYGAAGIMVILLTWVFYSSQILFFGAVFTLVYSRKYGANIYPAEYAVHVVRQEVESGRSALNAEPGRYARKEPD